MSFECSSCGRVSHHPKDESEQFCGICGFATKPTIDALFYDDGQVELICGGRRYLVKPDDGTEESGLQWSINQFKKLLAEEGVVAE